MLSQNYNELKLWLEQLLKEAPALSKLKCPVSAASVDGVLKQAQVAKEMGRHEGYLYLGYLDPGSNIGYSLRSYPVELKYAINLIKTMKKRT